MIKINNISFRYPDSNDDSPNRLDRISLNIDAGESIAVMGHNGSGKTTFARCLNALLLPSDGGIEVDDMLTTDDEKLQEIRRRVGMVFQNPDNQIVSATVEREIAFGLENLGIDPAEMHRRVDSMLHVFGLAPLRRHPPHLLSGGEKQRLAIAAVMAMQPRYLVLDEPTSLLDPQARRSILQTIAALHQTDPAITTMLVTQFPEEALSADRLIVFHQGAVAFDEAPATVFEQESELKKMGLLPPVSIHLRRLVEQYRQKVAGNSH